MTAPLEPRFVTLKQAAEITSVSRDTLARAIRTGQLKAKRSTAATKDNPTGKGAKTLVRVSDLDDWFERLADA